MIHPIPLSDIEPGKYQPRTSFNVDELAKSIKAAGLINPIIIRKTKKKYEIIAGERRYRAHVLLNYKTITSIIVDVDDGRAAGMALVENMQRADLNPMDEAEHLYIMKEFITSNLAEIARAIGKSRAWVSNRLRLLRLAECSKNALSKKLITPTHGRTLLQFNFREQGEIINEVLLKKLDLNEVSKLLKIKLKQSIIKTQPKKDIHILDLENTLSNQLNAPTKVTQDTISIDFHCKTELLGIIGRIINQK
ncbi:ParB/RepB/Spo0J family partition protein [Pseudoalteromonas marina]|uniref:ParB/RepB/Spo0J family partition protein n=1 Tax=Pseudoalteromonas marina TaxID=267375 RepID=A0ABT9FH20_9GAMM|nr:ParB/RepB/Spo0J family partition protein [Pseudoalteromonas marina]MDP2565791.1 ParB/RepB/Spo0J family partition protein [Pseudoalteromonas marina]